MNVQKLKPWNWFQHEETSNPGDNRMTVGRAANEPGLPAPAQQGWHPVFQLQREMDRLFDEAFQAFGFPSLRPEFTGHENRGGTLGFRPRLNISGKGNQYLIELEVPGMTEKDLKLELRGNSLRIQGQKEETKEDKDEEFYRMECRFGRFSRTLTLPDDALTDEIQASLKDGLLTLTIKRKEVPPSEVKKISISS